MTFTYCNNPAHDPKDAVRLYVGDTDERDALLQDEEIQFLLNDEGSIKRAAASAALAIAAKFSRLADEAVGRVRVDFSQKARAYTALASKLEMASDLSDAIPYGGGISISDKCAQENNTDRVPPIFTKHINENPTDATDVDKNECC